MIQRRAILAIGVMMAAFLLAIVPFALRRASVDSEPSEATKVIPPQATQREKLVAPELAKRSESVCPPSLEDLPQPSETSQYHCMVSLPPLAFASSDLLSERAEKLLEADDTLFPFTGESGYNISLSDARSVDDVMRARTEPGEKMPLCAPSTYDGHGALQLAKLFLPGGPGELRPGDEVIDLGAGIAKVLAVVALVSNASAKGIELSAQRFETGCAVLKQLQHLFVSSSSHLSAACPLSRRFELWHGDFLDPPRGFTESTAWGARNYFAYANCFPYGLLAKLMRRISQDRYPCVRFLSTKAPVSINPVTEGLRRAHWPGFVLYSLFTRDKDECKPI